MIGQILTETLHKLEQFQKTHPEDAAGINYHLEALKAYLKWFRNYWQEPTLEDLDA